MYDFYNPSFFEFPLQFSFTMVEKHLLVWKQGPCEIENLYNPSFFWICGYFLSIACQGHTCNGISCLRKIPKFDNPNFFSELYLILVYRRSGTQFLCRFRALRKCKFYIPSSFSNFHKIFGYHGRGTFAHADIWTLRNLKKIQPRFLFGILVTFLSNRHNILNMNYDT